MQIETERLTLRPISLGDLDEFARLHDDPEVTRFIARFDRAASRARLRQAEREWRERGRGMFAAIRTEDGRFLGRVGYKYWPQFDETEIGWVLRRDAWGQGYATEAARACVERGLAAGDVPYLTAMIDPANHPSIRVAQRLGMSILRSDSLLGVDVVVYAIGPADTPAPASG